MFWLLLHLCLHRRPVIVLSKEVAVHRMELLQG